jgi:hypothetical protein
LQRPTQAQNFRIKDYFYCHEHENDRISDLGH